MNSLVPGGCGEVVAGDGADTGVAAATTVGGVETFGTAGPKSTVVACVGVINGRCVA